MKNICKKIIVWMIVVTLSAGTGSILSVSDIYADEFAGDISENPWSDLFQGNKESGNLITDDSGEKITQNNTKITIKKASLKTSIKSATKKSRKAKKAKIVLKKITKVKGVRYQIKYAENKKLKKAKIRTYKKNRITLKRLRPNKRYYMKARAYVNAGKGKKVYGKWTKCKQIKVKKKK